MLFNYADRSRLTVAPFFTAGVFSTVAGHPADTRLSGLKFIGLAHGETVSIGCSFCDGASFGRPVTIGNEVVFSANSPPLVTSRTRLRIEASSPAQLGRFKVYAIKAASFRLPLISTGCLAPGATPVSPADPAALSSDAIPCPTTFVNPIGAEYVFWRGAQNGLWEKRYSGRGWSQPIPIRVGRLQSAPAVGVHANGEQDVFWKGTHGNLWETWYTGQWNGPIDLGAGQLGSAPTVGVDGAGDEYVFWKGTGGGLWDKSYSGGGWSQPVPLNVGRLASAPAVAVHPNGEQDVFWKGADGNLWETWYTGQWNGPVDLGGGQLGSAPCVAVDGAGDEYVFWTGGHGGLWEKAYSSGHWGQATLLSASGVVFAPAVAVHASGEQDVFWRGRYGNLWETWYTNRWNGPLDLGAGQLGSAPSAGVDAAGKQGTP